MPSHQPVRALSHSKLCQMSIRGFADTHSCGDLLKAAHRYVLQHFVDVAKTEEFMLLPLKQVTW